MMRSTFFWLLSFGGLVAVSFLCGLLVWPQLSAAWPSIEEKIDRFRRLPPLAKLLLLLFVGAFVVFGSTKPNQVDQTSETNIVEIVEGDTNDVDGADGAAGVCALPPVGIALRAIRDQPPPVTPEDIARGWQQWEVLTNCNIFYTMPEGATLATNWWVRGAYEDVKPIDFGSWRFPFGTNEYDSLWAFSWGKARFELGNTNTEIVAVGAPMSAVPYRSRLWSAAGANGSQFVTWENFVLGRAPVADYQLPSASYQLVSAQIELRATGDFIARSNEVETVYRRVDPDDWDGDGWENDDDGNPYEWEDFTDYFYQELPEGANTNAYCWVEIRPKWNSWISFYGDAPSNLEDPYLWAKAGETYRVQLLIGKTYDVESSQPFDIVAKSDERIEVSKIGANQCEVVWPVEFAVSEGRAPGSRPRLGATWNDGGKSFYVIPNPSWLRGAVTWTDNYCCDVWGDGTNFTYACDNTCTCEGCTVYGSYWYEGYGLPVNGIPCGCHYVPDHGPFEVMQFSFDKSAAIYEDDYTNMPGVVIHPTPSNVVLRCEVYGGTYGGRLTISLNAAGRSKIARVGGNLLPNNVEIPPDTTRVFETEYTPLEPSDRVNDIEATATYVENFRNESHTATATLTSVKLTLEADKQAPENPDKRRHVYGIAETVFVRYIPEADDGVWIVTTNGHEMARGNATETYVCPWTTNGIAGGKCDVNFCLGNSAYVTPIKVHEPFVVARNPRVNIRAEDVQPVTGEAGHLVLYLDMYVGPFFVSFTGIDIREVPDESQSGEHSGYYNDKDKGGNWSHTSYDGAGTWLTVSNNGCYGTDKAGCGHAYPAPWSEGYKEWPIPMEWGISPMPFGTFKPQPTTQRFSLTSLGTFTIKKFGYEVSRNPLGWIWGDGAPLFGGSGQ